MGHVEGTLYDILQSSDWIDETGVKEHFEDNLQHLEKYVTLAEEELAVLRR
jgi:hypothetical protein